MSRLYLLHNDYKGEVDVSGFDNQYAMDAFIDGMKEEGFGVHVISHNACFGDVEVQVYKKANMDMDSFCNFIRAFISGFEYGYGL